VVLGYRRITNIRFYGVFCSESLKKNVKCDHLTIFGHYETEKEATDYRGYNNNNQQQSKRATFGETTATLGASPVCEARQNTIMIHDIQLSRNFHK
jgi:hypothetical protein